MNVFKNDIIPEYVGDYPTEMVETLGGNTMVISKLMFSEYILPFEATSILLLGAIVGTVAIAMRRSKMTR